MTTVTFGVDGPEWDSLYENPENKQSRHRIGLGASIEAQLSLWPALIVNHWDWRKSKNQLAYLGLDSSKPTPERIIISLREESNLCLVSAVARQIVKRPWGTDSKKQRISILLDCSIPIVLSEDVEKGASSAFIEREGAHFVSVCFLFGSIAFSGSAFRAPIVGKVRRIFPLRTLPPINLVELDLQLHEVIPETRVSYHAEPLVVPEPQWSRTLERT